VTGWRSQGLWLRSATQHTTAANWVSCRTAATPLFRFSYSPTIFVWFHHYCRCCHCLLLRLRVPCSSNCRSFGQSSGLRQWSQIRARDRWAVSMTSWSARLATDDVGSGARNIRSSVCRWWQCIQPETDEIGQRATEENATAENRTAGTHHLLSKLLFNFY